MRFTSALVAATVLLGVQTLTGAPEDEKKADPTALVGTYEIVAGERAGAKLPPAEVQGVTVRIAKNAFTTYDKDKKEVYVATYELDPSSKPWRIHMTGSVTPVEGGKGTKAEGLVAVEGDTVKLIYALPGGKAPTDFKAGEKQQFFLLKRTGK